MIHPLFPIPAIDPNIEFYVDANVLFYSYDQGNQNNPSEKMKAYSKFLTALAENGNSLYISSLNLQEVLHLIEKIEHSGYCTASSSHIGLKKYRRNNPERKKVQQKLNAVLQHIKSNYSVADDGITFENIESFVQNYDKHLYDPIDFFVTNARNRSTLNYITDDSDFKDNSKFQTNPFINLYTYKT